jgi:hypothetical protein
MPRLPSALVEDLRSTKSLAHPDIYHQACQFVIDLDNKDLLNDQIFSSVDEDGVVGFEWPNYGLSLDIYPDGKHVCNSVKDGIYAHIFSHESMVAMMAMVLERHIDKNDTYDAFKNRSLENTVWVDVPF